MQPGLQSQVGDSNPCSSEGTLLSHFCYVAAGWGPLTYEFENLGMLPVLRCVVLLEVLCGVASVWFAEGQH